MIEQVPLSCNVCKKIFNEDLEEARKYSKSNPFICHQCQALSNNPSPKLSESDLTVHSRHNESNTLNDPDVIAAAQRQSHDDTTPIIANPSNNQPYGLPPTARHASDTTPELHHPNTLEYYESVATGEVKHVLDSYKERRERINRELAEERARTARYNEGGTHSIIPIAIGIVMTIMTLVIMLGVVVPSLTSTVTDTLDCSGMDGNAGPHQTVDNASGMAKQCLIAKTSFSSTVTTLPLVILVVLTAVILLTVVRLLK